MSLLFCVEKNPVVYIDYNVHFNLKIFSLFSQNQGILIETIQQENAKYTECQSAKNLLVMVC